MTDIHEAPTAFNPNYREGYGEALSAEYTAWSQAHPEHTHEEGRAAHLEISIRLTPLYPSVAEKGEYQEPSCHHNLWVIECMECYK